MPLYRRRPRTVYSGRYMRSVMHKRKRFTGTRRLGGNYIRDSRQRYPLGVSNAMGRFKGIKTFPDRQRFDAKFSDDSVTLSTAAGGLANNEFVYRLNSISDPRFAAGGVSVEYFTTLSNVWKWYLVDTVEIEIITMGGTSPTSQLAILLQDPDSPYSMVGKSVVELCKDRQVTLVQMDTSGGPNAGTVFRKRVSLASLSGLTKAQWAANFPTYGALMTNPTKSPWLRIAAIDFNGVAGANVLIRTNITFYGSAWGRVQPYT